MKDAMKAQGIGLQLNISQLSMGHNRLPSNAGHLHVQKL